jgi:hypothetical protein
MFLIARLRFFMRFIFTLPTAAKNKTEKFANTQNTIQNRQLDNKGEKLDINVQKICFFGFFFANPRGKCY